MVREVGAQYKNSVSAPARVDATDRAVRGLLGQALVAAGEYKEGAAALEVALPLAPAETVAAAVGSMCLVRTPGQADFSRLYRLTDNEPNDRLNNRVLSLDGGLPTPLITRRR